MKKLLLLLAEGFEEIEALTAADLLRRAGMTCELCATGSSLSVRGAHGISVNADLIFHHADPGAYDGVILPGGTPGTRHLSENNDVIGLLQKYSSEGKLTAAICAAPTVLATAGLLNGKNAVCYPGMEKQLSAANVMKEPAVTDGTVITGRGVGTAISFALEIVRYYNGEAASQKLAKEIVFS
ncbi:MAG: DJ-1/PfpI family protein [Oscillospiraceae bacterium]|nr:DJ-1/PfpI family protein [Oscillospiraceae bacterium]